MQRYIDLTHVIKSDMPVYPGDDGVSLYPCRAHEKDRYSNHCLCTQMHAGTHIDGPMHLVLGGAPLSQTPIDTFFGRAAVLEVKRENTIETKPEYEEIIGDNPIVLLYTGHSSKFNLPDYFVDFPVVSNSFAELLVKKRVKLLGMDTPSPDKPPHTIHKLLLGCGIPILENLTNLDKLNSESKYELIALPLLIDADSAPARVVARVL